MGKSKSEKFPYGERKVINGKELAPRSLRKKGKKYLSDCTKNELINAGVEEKYE